MLFLLCDLFPIAGKFIILRHNWRHDSALRVLVDAIKSALEQRNPHTKGNPCHYHLPRHCGHHQWSNHPYILVRIVIGNRWLPFKRALPRPASLTLIY